MTKLAKHCLALLLCAPMMAIAQMPFVSPMADPIQIVSTTGEGWTAPVFMDLDGDDRKDMLMSKRYDDRLVWHKNLGDGEYGPETMLYQNLDGIFDMKIFDMNGDGLQDLLILAYDGHTLYAALRHEDGTLGFPEPVTSLMANPYGCAAGDINGDGLDDVIAFDYSGHKLFWMPSLGSEFALESNLISNRTNPQYGATVDLNLDGNIDVLAAHGSGGVWAYFNTAAGWEEFQVFSGGNHQNQIQTIHEGNTQHVFSTSGSGIHHRSLEDGVWSEAHLFAVPSLSSFAVQPLGDGSWIMWTSALEELKTWQTEDFLNGELLDVVATEDPYRYLSSPAAHAEGESLWLVGSVYSPNRIYGHVVEGDLPAEPVAWTTTQVNQGFPLRFVQSDQDAEEELMVRSGSDLLLFDPADDGSWGDGTMVMNGVLISDLDAADIDGDGDDDILMGSYTEDRLAWLESYGDGSYSAIRTLSLTANCYDVHWEDVNGDGLLDATAATHTEGELFVFLQEASSENIEFASGVDIAESFTQFENILEMAWGDVNNDGKLDVVVAHGVTSAVGLQAEGMVFEWSAITTGSNQKVDIASERNQIMIDDIDGNGWNEIVFGNHSYQPSYIANDSGDPEDWTVRFFSEDNPFTNTAGNKYIDRLHLLDLNNDGKGELLSCYQNGNDGVYGRSLGANGEVSNEINLIPNVQNYTAGANRIIDADFSDVDGDGDLDMIAIQYPQNILYYSENQLEDMGCTQALAVNYEPEALIDNGLCVFLGDACDDGMSATYNDAIQTDGSCLGQAFNGNNLMRINCGYTNGDLSDVEGNVWMQEQFAIGGGNTATGAVASSLDDEIMRYARYSTTGYDLPVEEAGQYLVRLHFVATRSEVQLPGIEVFHVLLEGDTVAADFDIYAEAGNRQTWISREYFVETLDEVISLRLPIVEFSNEISGIEVFQYQGDCVDLDLDDVCDDIEVLGCQDSAACNFDETSTEDDGTCEFVSCSGCMEPVACNFDPEATFADASCDFPSEGYDCDGTCSDDFDLDGICDPFEIAGCIYATATNFMPSATDDDGSCVFEGAPSGLGCTYPDACNFDPDSNVDDGSCEYPLPARACDGTCFHDQDEDGICDEFEGCTIPTACNYNAAALDNDGCCIFANEGEDCLGQCIIDTDQDGICDENELPGCMDTLACNYSSLATDDNGACVYPTLGQDCEGNCLSDLDGDGVCDADEVVGCADEAACNFDGEVTDPDGSCTYSAFYYDCEANCLNDADSDGICDELEAQGCTYPTAMNYSQSATDDDGSCVFEGNGIVGCFYSIACNYDSEATEDDGSCIFATDGLNCEGECLLDCDGDGICDDFEVAGCMDASACNYNAGATDAMDNCEYLSCADCMDEGACNFNPTALYASDTCEFESCAGCMLADACNFDALATIADEGCEFESCAGCTYPDADNYDPSATIDDGSCVMDGALEMVADSAYDSGYSDGLTTGEVECEDDVTNAFTDGFNLGTTQSSSNSEACGPGTIWNESYSLCLPEPICEGDLDENGHVGVEDLLLLLAYFDTLCD